MSLPYLCDACGKVTEHLEHECPALEMDDAAKDKLAEALRVAWEKYLDAFGVQPHGTYKQLRAMIELLPRGFRV